MVNAQAKVHAQGETKLVLVRRLGARPVAPKTECSLSIPQVGTKVGTDLTARVLSWPLLSPSRTAWTSRIADFKPSWDLTNRPS